MLTSVEIKNFRSCRSTNLEFNKTVSALVGKNGTGKTNILQCIERLADVGYQSIPIRIETPVDEKPGDDGFSLRVNLCINGVVYEYSFAAPSRHALDALYHGRFTVEEKLYECEGESGPVELISRRGEEVKILGREGPIRISAFSYTIGALISLLPANDPIRVRLEPISSFFSGVSYYSLNDRSEISDIVSEKAYKEWAQRVKGGMAATESVSLRLLYMMSEDADTFAEFQALIGPDGLDLVSRTELVRTPIPHVPGGAVAGQMPVGESYFFVAFEPSPQIGGSGYFFPLSQLSDGTRRAIRAITALLFDKRSLMLMEQPEDSMHPGLLEKLIDIVRSYSSRSQIVFTTHSPDVLDLLEPDELILVTAPKGKTQARRLSPDETLRAKQYLKDQGSLSEFVEIAGEE